MHAARNRLYTSTAIPGGVDMISDRPWPAELTSGGMVLEPYGALQWSVLLQHTNRGGTTRLPGIQEEENAQAWEMLFLLVDVQAMRLDWYHKLMAKRFDSLMQYPAGR